MSATVTYCEHCGHHIAQRVERALDGTEAVVWAAYDHDDGWTCERNGGDEHVPRTESMAVLTAAWVATSLLDYLANLDGTPGRVAWEDEPEHMPRTREAYDVLDGLCRAAVKAGDNRVYTRDEVVAALNRAANDVDEAAGLPDEGARDCVNLTVNAALNYLDGSADNLADVVEQNYDDRLDEVLRWCRA